MEITKSVISGNHGGIKGGGISNYGTLTITDTTLSGNLAGTNLQGSGFGGGISSGGPDAAITITNSTIAGNSAGGKGGGRGGGVSSGGTLEISNSSISGNFAHLNGGGVANGGSLHISNSTISNNSANETAGGINNSGTLEIGNTIVNAGPSGANIMSSGDVISHGYNMSSDDAGGYLTGPCDQINTNPLLGPLQDNGGPTFTHELLLGSPAIDAGDPNFTPPPFDDQRGARFIRVFNGRIDIGSFEAQPTPRPVSTPRPRPTPRPR
jgi:hypothetical protein